jgi:hypothetical protein
MHIGIKGGWEGSSYVGQQGKYYVNLRTVGVAKRPENLSRALMYLGS